MGTRVQPLDLQKASENDRAALSAMFSDGADPTGDFYATLALVPDAVANYQKSLSRILANEGRPLAPTLRELAILRQAVVSDCRYLFREHINLARQVGVSDAKIAAIKGWSTSDVYDDAERAVMAATDDMIGLGRVQDETIDALKRELSDAAVTELLYVVGIFEMVSTFVRSLQLEDDTDIADRLFVIPKAAS